MTAIARDAVAAAQLVYAWPFPFGPDCQVACADDEYVVMCPAWLVGDRLGPGHHHWRTPDPTRPSSAYFVLTAPVEVPFDMTTTFVVPSTGQRVRLHAAGSLQVRCADAQLLVAQFVGLPFDDINGGILRSVSRSVERMLARLLTRRVVLASSALVVTDLQNQPAIIEELVAYNPAAGAVFGVEMIRMGHLMITADDGVGPLKAQQTQDWGRANGASSAERPPTPRRRDEIPMLETVRGRPQSMPPVPNVETAPVITAPPQLGAPPPPAPAPGAMRRSPSVPPGQIAAEPTRKKTPRMGVPEMPAPARATPSGGSPIVSSSMGMSASGEIGLPGARTTAGSMPAMVILAADEPTPPPAVPPPPIRPSAPLRAVSPTQPGTAAGPLAPSAGTLPPPLAKASPSIPTIPVPDRLTLPLPPPPLPRVPPPTGAAAPAAVSGEIGAGSGVGVRFKPKTVPPPLPPAPVAPAAAPAPDDDDDDEDGGGDHGITTIEDVGIEAAGAITRTANGSDAAAPRGSIMGIGMSSIAGQGQEVKGGSAVAGEIQKKVAPGSRVLVPGPNGLMQSATVRQLLQGYYELEVGSTGQTIWVPIGGVVPE